MNKYLLDPEVCPASLGEDDKPIDPENTAHRWSDQMSSDDYNKPVRMCEECGATKD